MKFTFLPMNREFAEEIAYNWKYNGIYSFYDMTADEEDLEEFMNPQGWGKYKFAVINDESELIGFYVYYFKDGIMWIGFGLKPELTGQGLGVDFVKAGIRFGIKKYKYKKRYLMLAVASFNQRAVKVYQRVGFKIMGKYLQKTNGGEYEFFKMKKRVWGLYRYFA